MHTTEKRKKKGETSWDKSEKTKTHITLPQPNVPSKLSVHDIKTNTVERKKIVMQYGKQR